MPVFACSVLLPRRHVAWGGVCRPVGLVSLVWGFLVCVWLRVTGGAEWVSWMTLVLLLSLNLMPVHHLKCGKWEGGVLLVVPLSPPPAVDAL